jgi:phenylacetic acid degradation operon negative regulatory protein
LVNRELLVRERAGRHISYRLTDRARRLLQEGDERIFSLGRSAHEAELWTVLWHAIPEERRLERTPLTRRLRFLGFGSLQDGTWISPHNREREVLAILDEPAGVGERGAAEVFAAGEGLQAGPVQARDRAAAGC